MFQDENEKKLFKGNNTQNYIGDSGILPYLSYTKSGNANHLCIYCHNKANSREHIPPRCFLQKPYKENLSIVPACKQCNNSFSKDELVVSRLLRWVSYSVNKDNSISISELKGKYDYYQSKYGHTNIIEIELDNVDVERISNVIYKIARGHILYDMSTLVDKNKMDIHFAFSFSSPPEYSNMFDPNVVLLQEKMSELGSREGQQICEFSSGEDIAPGLMWKTVQEGTYRYLLDPSGMLLIAMHKLLYVQVLF